jgi:hypothetical protein
MNIPSHDVAFLNFILSKDGDARYDAVYFGGRAT